MLSVIIPVYNAEDCITNILSNLVSQLDLSSGDEIIVVDNGSEDRTPEIVKGFEGAMLLTEKNYLSSPYSCRNRGIEYAGGDYLIFLDASCTPSAEWAKSFKKCVKDTDADLLGGNIHFSLSEYSTVSELADAVNNVNIELSIKAGHAMTANLLVKKEVIDEIGLFPEGIRSGGDVRWTRTAIQQGFKLNFCPNAMVLKEPRKFKSLMKKSWRVGKGLPQVWRQNGHITQAFLKATLKLILPPNFLRMRKKAIAHSYDINFLQWIGIVLTVWLNQWIRTSAAYYMLMSTDNEKQ